MNLFRKPLVSVIMASYNHEEFVKEAVLSVLGQSVDSLELFIVDDGSTDKTPDVIGKIKDKRIRFFPLKENRKVHPRNFALKMAKGKYIAIQNSDDVWEKDKLERQLQVMESDPNISACFTAVDAIDQNGKVLKDSWASNIFTTENKKSEEWLRRFFDIGNCLCISSVLIRHSKLRKIGHFNESFIQLSDFDMWVKLASVGELHIIDKKLTKMRVVKGKNLSEPSPQSHRRGVLEYIELLDLYTEPPILNRLKEIFGSSLPENANTRVELLGALAKYAWTLSSTQKIFANRLITRIIQDSRQREELTDFYGAEIIQEYIKQKGRVDVYVQDEG